MKKTAATYLSKLFKTAWEFKFSFLFFAYLYVTAFLPNHFVFSGNILISLFALMGLNLILSKGKQWVRIIPNILFIFLISLSAFFAFLYSSWVWTEAILSILRTNADEAVQMGATFLLPALLIIGITSILALLSQKELRGLKHPAALISAIAVSAYSFAFLPFMVNRIIERIEFRTIRDNPVTNARYTNMFAPVLFGNIVSVYAATNELGKIKELLKMAENKAEPKGIVLTDENSPYQRIVMVVGESSNMSHYSLYGYDRETTPFLDSLNNANTPGFSYFDAISPASSTVLSLFRSLSFASLADAKAAYQTKSVIDLANDAGYKTYWISAQDPIGESNSEVGLLALSTSRQIYLNEHINGEKLDINLIPYLQEIYNKDEKQLIIIHLMGSHIYYSARIDDTDRTAIADSDRNANAYNSVDDYDRSVHHTDRVLKGIYETVKQDPHSLILYASDHGEVVGLGHGYNKQYGDQHQIPFLILDIASHSVDPMIVKYSTPTDERIRFNTVNLSYVLSEYLGYQVSDSLRGIALSDSPKILLQSGEVVDFDSVKDK